MTGGCCCAATPAPVSWPTSLCWAPPPVPLATLIRVAGTRWAIEEGSQAATGHVGLEHYPFRTWTGWHRHTMLAMLALAFLALLAADAALAPTATESTTHHGLLPLTITEIHHLITMIIIKPLQDRAHLLHWSH